MPCEICGHRIAQKHRLRPGAWGGTYDPANVVRLCPNHHASIHLLMRWYFGGKIARKDQEALDEIIDDRPLYQLWVDRARPIVRIKLAYQKHTPESRPASRPNPEPAYSDRPGRADLSPHDHMEDHTWSEARESAYRRGYHQALQEVASSTDGNVLDLRPIRGWLEEVQLWRNRLGRFAKGRSSVQPPPASPGQRAKFPHRWSDGSFRREEQPR